MKADKPELHNLEFSPNARGVFDKISVRKVPRCNVQLCETELTAKESETIEKNENSVEVELPRNLVKFDDQSFVDNINKQDIEENDRKVGN